MKSRAVKIETLAEFLAKGGEITKVKIGVTDFPFTNKYTRRMSGEENERKKQKRIGPQLGQSYGKYTGE